MSRIRSCSPAARSRSSTASSTARPAARRRAASAASSRSSCWSAAPRRSGWLVERLCRGSLLGAARRGRRRSPCWWRSAASSSMSPPLPSALDTGGLAGGREAVRHIVGRDPMSLDAHGVARAAIESLAENFSDGVVAPVFWYLLLGLPGLFAYKMANTLDSMIGHRTPRYRSFGWAAARLDDLLNLVPAPLSGAAARDGGGVRREVPAGRALGDHAARRAQAPFAECRLAGGGDGRRARSRAGRAAPLRRGPRRRSVARRRHARARRRPTSRGRCGSIASPACSRAGCLLGAWLAAHVTLPV